MESGTPQAAAAHLIATQRWFALSTVEADGTPGIGYIPFACVDGAFAMVASRLAAHTANLLARRPASILLVAGGPDPDDAYTRARFSLRVAPRPLARGSAAANAVWSALVARQGATVAILQTLADFEAITLEPTSGRLVLGFAAAYDLDASDVVHVLARPAKP
jgi:putative heme iron utilization protein